MTLKLHPRLRVTLRILLAFIGGYFLSVGAATLLGVALTLAGGGTRMDAFFAAGMSSSLIFCGVLVWGFAERRLLLFSGTCIAGSMLFFWAARLLETSIPIPA